MPVDWPPAAHWRQVPDRSGTLLSGATLCRKLVAYLPWWAARLSGFPPASWEDAMTSDNTPRDAVGRGIWGNLGVWIAFGSAFGLLVGGFFDNVALGLTLGPGVAVACWAVFIAQRNDHRES